jgi:peptide/nickel transport system substrate-binding protein/oligopeptide transport system substrate-binding protein
MPIASSEPEVSLMLCRFTLLLVCALALAACQLGAGPQPARGGQPSGELRWSLEGISDLPSIDPARSGGSQANAVIGMVFGGLVRLDRELKVQPDGAESWTVSEEGTVYTFKIRSGLQFADGTPVTAGDFAYSINRALAPETKSFGAPSQLRHIVGALDVTEGRAGAASGVEAPDDRTLVIRLDLPIAYFLAQLTYPYTFVLPRALVDSAGPTWFERAYGTGPFKIKRWDHGKQIELEANTRYWRGAPGIATIRMPIFQDSEVAYQRYRAGELDIMGSQQNGVPADRVAEVSGLPDFRTSPGTTIRYIGFNNQLPPFNNEFVRAAFALAADKRALTEQVLAGTVVPTDRILPVGFPGSQIPVRGQSFDPVGARQALGLAGFVSGQGLPPITFTYAIEGDNQKVVEALRDDWRDTLGVNVTLEPLELEAFIAGLDTTRLSPDKGLQMYLSVWGADYPDPHNFISQQLRSDSPYNNGHWSDPEFDSLVGRADTMGGQDQIDQRLSLYAQAEQIALDTVGWLPLYNTKLNVLVRPTIQGLYFTPQGIVADDWGQVRIGQ